MKSKLLEDFTKERDAISSELKDKRLQKAEIEKYLSSTVADISVLEGRLMEIEAIIKHVETLDSGPTEDIES